MEISASKDGNTIDFENDDLVLRADKYVTELKLDGYHLQVPNHLLPVCQNSPEKVKELYRKIIRLNLSANGIDLITRKAATDVDDALGELDSFEKEWITDDMAFFRIEPEKTVDPQHPPYAIGVRVDNKFYRLFTSDRKALSMAPLLKSPKFEFVVDANFPDLWRLRKRIEGVIGYAKLVRNSPRWLESEDVAYGLNWIASGRDPEKITKFTALLTRAVGDLSSGVNQQSVSMLYRLFFADERIAARLDSVVTAQLEREAKRQTMERYLEAGNPVRLKHGALLFGPSLLRYSTVYVTDSGEVYVKRGFGFSTLSGTVNDLESGLSERILEEPREFGLERLEGESPLAKWARNSARKAGEYKSLRLSKRALDAVGFFMGTGRV